MNLVLSHINYRSFKNIEILHFFNINQLQWDLRYNIIQVQFIKHLYNFTSLIWYYYILQRRMNNWRQQFIEAYNISNQSTSYREQSYDQNKLSFDSIASQMTASQVKNRKSKFSALTQVKIDGETRVHQRRRKNHQFRQ